jgi:hypothetical protein
MDEGPSISQFTHRSCCQQCQRKITSKAARSLHQSQHFALSETVHAGE